VISAEKRYIVEEKGIVANTSISLAGTEHITSYKGGRRWLKEKAPTPIRKGWLLARKVLRRHWLPSARDTAKI
jgi:hypothetical protein